MKKPRIAAYSLCYMEGALLAANIRRMYDLIDDFHIVIGAANTGPHYRPPPDRDSFRILVSMPDPQMKIHIAGCENGWVSKEIMTQVATAELDADLLLQLDADEFWPLTTFRQAVESCWTRDDSVAVRHAMFFGDCEHLAVPADDPLDVVWFAPPRLMRVVEGGSIVRHFQPAFVSRDGIASGNAAILTNVAPIWHFAWVGYQRVLRKRAYYANGRRMNVFSEAEWLEQPPDHEWQINGSPVLVKQIQCPLSLRPDREMYEGVMEALGEAVVAE